jgi:hypothetical protein
MASLLDSVTLLFYTGLNQANYNLILCSTSNYTWYNNLLTVGTIMSRQNKQKKKAVIAAQVKAAHKDGNKMQRTTKLHHKRKTKCETRIQVPVNTGN